MNQTEEKRVRDVVARAKKCIFGTLATEFASRLPEKPDELTNWEKYNLIKSGAAKLKKLKMKDLMQRYSTVDLIDAFDYPKREEEKAFNEAEKGMQQERIDREMAVEQSFDRVADERVMGLITAKEFLDTVEKMSAQSW